MPIKETQQEFVKTVVSCLLEKRADEKLAPVTIMTCGDDKYGDRYALGFSSEVKTEHDFSKQFSESTKSTTKPIKVFGIIERAGRYYVSSAVLTPSNAVADEKSADWSVRELEEWDPSSLSKNEEANFNICIAYILKQMFADTVALDQHAYAGPIKNIVDNWQLLNEMDDPVSFLNKKLSDLQSMITQAPKPELKRFSPSKISPSLSPSSLTILPYGVSSPAAADIKKPLQNEWQWTGFEKFISDNVKILSGNDEKAKPAAVKQLQEKVLPFIKDGRIKCTIKGEVERTKILELLKTAAASLAYGLTAFPEEKETEIQKRDRIENAAWMFYRRLRLPGKDKAENVIGGAVTADTKTAEKADAKIKNVFDDKISIDALVEFKSQYVLKGIGDTRDYFIAMVNKAIVYKYLNLPVSVASLNIITAAIVENVGKDKDSIAIKIDILKMLATSSADKNIKSIFSDTVVTRFLMVNCEKSQAITNDEKIKLYKAIADGSSAESLVARWRFITLSLEKGVQTGQVKLNTDFEQVLEYLNNAPGDPESEFKFDLKQIEAFWKYAGNRIKGEKFLAILVKLSERHPDHSAQYWIYNDVAKKLFNDVSTDASKQHVFFTHLRARVHGLCNAAYVNPSKNVPKEIDSIRAKLRDCLDSKDAKQSLAQRITNAAILLDLPKTDSAVDKALETETKAIVDLIIKGNLQLLVDSCEIQHADKLWSFIQNNKNIVEKLADDQAVTHAILAKLADSKSVATPQLKTTRNAILTALFTHAKLKPIALEWAKKNPAIWNQYGHEKINGRLLLLVALDAWKANNQQSALLDEKSALVDKKRALLDENGLLKWVDLQKANYPGLLFAELAKEIYSHPSVSIDTLFNVCKTKARSSETDTTHLVAALDALTAREPEKLFELFGRVGTDYKFSQFIQYCADKVNEPKITIDDKKGDDEAVKRLKIQSKTKIIAAFVSALFCLRSKDSVLGSAAYYIKHIDSYKEGWVDIEIIHPKPLKESDIDKLLFFAKSEDTAKAVWKVAATKKSELFMKVDLAKLFAIVFKDGPVKVGESNNRVLLPFSISSVTAAFNELLAQPQEQICHLFEATSSGKTLAEVLQDILKNPASLLQTAAQQSKAERAAELFFCDEKAFSSDKANVKTFLLKMFKETDNAETKKANGNALIRMLVHLEKLHSRGLVSATCLKNIKAIIKEEAHLRIAIANCDAKEIVGITARELLIELRENGSWLTGLSSEQKTAFAKLLSEDQLKIQLEICTAKIKTMQSNLGVTKANLQTAPQLQEALYTNAAAKPFAKQFDNWLTDLKPDDFNHNEVSIHTALNNAVTDKIKYSELEKSFQALLVYYKPTITYRDNDKIAALAKAIAGLFSVLKIRNDFINSEANIIALICKDKNYAEFNAVVSLVWKDELATTKTTYDALRSQHEALESDIKHSEMILDGLLKTHCDLVSTALSDPNSFVKFRALNALRNFYAVAKEVRDSEEVVSYTEQKPSGSVSSDAKKQARQGHAQQLVAGLSEFETAIGKEVLNSQSPLTIELQNKIKAYLLANKETIATIKAAVLVFQPQPGAEDDSVDENFVSAVAELLAAANDSKSDAANELSNTAKELQVFVKTQDYTAIVNSIKALHYQDKNLFKLGELYVAITATYNKEVEQADFLKSLKKYPEVAQHFNKWVIGNSRAQQNGWLAHFDNDIIKTVLADDEKPVLKAAKLINIFTHKTTAKFNQTLFNECIVLCIGKNGSGVNLALNAAPVLNAVKDAILKPLSHNVTQNDLLEYLLEYLKLNSTHLPEIMTGEFFKQIAHLPAAATKLRLEPFKDQILKQAKSDILGQTYCDALVALYSTDELQLVVKTQSDRENAKALLLAMLGSAKHGPTLVKNFGELNKLMWGLGISFNDLMTVYGKKWTPNLTGDQKHSPVNSAALHNDAHLLPMFIMSEASTAVVFNDNKPAEKTFGTPKKPSLQVAVPATPSKAMLFDFVSPEVLVAQKIKCFAAAMQTTKFTEPAVAIRPQFWLMLFEHDQGRTIIKQLLPASQPVKQTSSLDQKSDTLSDPKRKARAWADINGLLKDVKNIDRIWSAIDRAPSAQIDSMLAVFIDNKLITEIELSKLIVEKNLKNVALQQLIRIVGNKELSVNAIAPLIKILLTPVVDSKLFENAIVKKWIFGNWEIFPEFLAVLLKQNQFVTAHKNNLVEIFKQGKITAVQYAAILQSYLAVDSDNAAQSAKALLINYIPTYLKSYKLAGDNPDAEYKALGVIVESYIQHNMTNPTANNARQLFDALDANKVCLNGEVIPKLVAVYNNPVWLHAALSRTEKPGVPSGINAVQPITENVSQKVIAFANKDVTISCANLTTALGNVLYSHDLNWQQKNAVGQALVGCIESQNKITLVHHFNTFCANDRSWSTASKVGVGVSFLTGIGWGAWTAYKIAQEKPLTGWEKLGVAISCVLGVGILGAIVGGIVRAFDKTPQRTIVFPSNGHKAMGSPVRAQTTSSANDDKVSCSDRGMNAALSCNAEKTTDGSLSSSLPHVRTAPVCIGVGVNRGAQKAIASSVKLPNGATPQTIPVGSVPGLNDKVRVQVPSL